MHGCLGSRPAAHPPDGTLSPSRRIGRPALAGPVAAALDGGARVLLTAEAGYGKTALLDEALALHSREAVRLSGREADDLAAWIDAALRAGATIVLDDADALPAEQAGVVQALLDASSVAVAVAARRSLGLALGRLRAEGTLVELTAAELAFNVRECAELLRARSGRDPVGRDVERVMAATEGWPFGVALTAAGRTRGDGADALAFLRDEVLDRLEPGLRAVLVDAATPDALDARLAQAVGLDAEALAELAGAGVFLRPCDPDRRTYRFHPLFRTLLRERAAAERPADRTAALHARVAAALAEEGWSPQAVEHWLAAGDSRGALAAVAAAGLELAATPPETLARWHHALGAEGCGDLGERLLAGALAYVAGQPERATEALGAAVTRARDDGDDAGEWTARALMAAALHALSEPDLAVEVAAGFDGPIGWRAGPAAPAAAMSAALALAAAGRAEESRVLAGAALRHPAGGPLTGLEHLRQAQLDLPRGRLEGAATRLRAAADVLEEADPFGRRPALLACAATLLAEQGADDEALAAFEQAAAAAAARSDRRLAAAVRAQRALLLVGAGSLAEAELELGRAGSVPAACRDAAHEAAVAAVAAVRGDASDALAAADRAIAAAARGPLAERLSVTATLAPLMAEAGAPGLAGETVARALAEAEERLGAEDSAWARARLLVQRAWLAGLRGDEGAADADAAAAWTAAADARPALVRREWPRLRGLVWGALERGALAPEDVLPAIERAWPGGAALLPFTDHPLAAVRRRAVAPVVASGHPRALGQLKDLALEGDDAVAAAARAAIESVRLAPPPLSFRLLGGFEARRGTWRIEPSAWGRPMTARLVRFLLVHRGRVVPEDVLFEAFWAGKPAASARRNLQVAVSMARGVLDTGLSAESVIESVDHGYRLRLAAHDAVDTEEFTIAARAALAERDEETRRALLERATGLWHGEPLPEDTYADWSRDWRRALTDLYGAVLEALVAACREEADHRATIAAATRLLELDPLNEAVHRDLMAAYARTGRVADALRQYLHCRRLLVDELGVEPSAPTSLMQGRILAGEFA